MAKSTQHNDKGCHESGNYLVTEDDRPLVSIVIPVFNGERYVEEAINSALNQTYPNIEIIIIDDGSTDTTPAILKKFEHNPVISILSHKDHKNRGVSYSRKLGIDRAKGKYIALLDADDIFLPTKIEIQVDKLEKNSNVVLCHSDVDFIIELKEVPVYLKEFFHIGNKEIEYQYSAEPYFLLENHICTPTIMVKGDVVRNLPYYSDQLFQLEDWLMGVLIAESGNFLYMPDCLTYYRYHPASFTARNNSKSLNWMYSKIEFYSCVLARLPDDKKRSIAVSELQKSIVRLIKMYRDSGTGNKNQSFVPVSRIYQEIFIGGFNESIRPINEQYQSIISSFTAEDIAKEFSVLEISKALMLRLARRIIKPKSRPVGIKS
jgi:glycosyltransferase involved in cell wall biosynthesis